MHNEPAQSRFLDSPPAQTPADFLNSKNQAELVLIRGLPGSGKSTMAGALSRAGYDHFEADMFFMRGGKYEYNATRIRDAHAWCQKMTREALTKGRRMVVSNTFTTLREIEPYRSMTKNVRIIQAIGK